MNDEGRPPTPRRVGEGLEKVQTPAERVGLVSNLEFRVWGQEIKVEWHVTIRGRTGPLTGLLVHDTVVSVVVVSGKVLPRPGEKAKSRG